jgi:hypothetical protein
MNQKVCPSYAESGGSLSNWSARSQLNLDLSSAKSRLKLLPREGSDEVQSRPCGLGVRSNSNPKERTGKSHKHH